MGAKIIAIDTNVLLDFRLKRKPGFSKIYSLINQALESKASLYIPLPVFLEVEWVLRSFYKASKISITEFLEELLLIENVLTDDKDLLKSSLNLFNKNNKISFTDSLIIMKIKKHNYEFLTYDKELKKIYQSIL